MSETYDWTARVDQATAASVHEQLRTVLRDAEEMLNKFTASAYEQGGLLLDAQRETEAAVERKIAELSSALTASVDAMRRDIASLEARVDTSLRTADERFAKIQAQLEGILRSAPVSVPTPFAS